MNENEKARSRRLNLALAANRLFFYFGMESVLDGLERLFPVLAVKTIALTAANPYHDDKGRFTTGPEEESGGKGVQADLETKKGINIGDHISFVPQGKSSTITVKVTGKDRGKGSGISGQRVVGGVVKPGINSYQVPTGVKTVKTAGENLVQQRVATRRETAASKVGPSNAAKVINAEKMYGTGSRQHLEAQARFGTPAQKIAANAAERERIKNAAGETTGNVAARLAGMKERVAAVAAKQAAESEAQRARNAINPGQREGFPGGQRTLAEARATVAAEVEKRKAEIAAAVNEPSKVQKSIEWNGTMPLSIAVQTGVGMGANALEQAGLKGDHGSVAVKMDDFGQSRNGAYQPGMNQIKMNDRLDSGNAAFTFAHEYGHHLDWFEANRTGSKKMSADLEFRRIVRATPEWKTLQKDTQGVYTGTGRDRGRAAYLSAWPELFARATAQWAAVRSGDRSMLTVLDRRSIDHWSGASFAAIGKYLDKTLAKSSKSVRASGGVEEFGEGNPYHDEKGRFAPGPSSSTIDTMVSRLKENEGGSINPRTGKDVQEGYAVATGTHSSITPAAEFFANPEKVFKDWIKSGVATEFKNPAVHVGLWYDKEHGEVVLDPSEQVMNREDAIKLGRSRDQQGIFDLKPKGEGYIDTGGSGGR